MTENECLKRMVAPGTRRPGKYREGVIQIHVTRACNMACCNCTQSSQFGGRVEFMGVELFEQAVRSLDGYFGVVGVFGGNPCMSPRFAEYCEVLQRLVPFERRGLWSNDPINEVRCRAAAATFDPSISNLNVHMDRGAYDRFVRWWPECRPVGLETDSRHSPVLASMVDLDVPEEERWERISRCDINQHWSAMIGVFRGQLRAWFCEVAGAQAMLRQHDESYPDTGLKIVTPSGRVQGFNPNGLPTCDDPNTTQPYGLLWWQLPMVAFREQVREHCHKCGVPMRGHGSLAVTNATNQTTAGWADVARPKRKDHRIELVQLAEGLGAPLGRMTNYLGNAR